MLTRLSVLCAERIVATSSSKGRGLKFALRRVHFSQHGEDPPAPFLFARPHELLSWPQGYHRGPA